MNKFRTVTMAALLAGTLASHAWLEVGTPAPAFRMTNSHDTVISLDDQKGNYTVLEWYNPESPYVLKLYDSQKTQSLQQKYAQRNVTWITINSSAPDAPGYRNKSAANHDLNKRGASPRAIVVDSDGTLARLFDIQVAPEVVIINPEGTIIYTGAVDDAPSKDPGDIEDAMNYIELFLDAHLKNEDVEDSEPSNPPYGTPIR